ncbi:Uncharacterised protein [Nocardia farcinica]|uniref:hypothetical protein n=1 Tax=Nocardia farcinica TaxID=37329 RepID=UPI000E04AB3E|nr:hypothetical protein [Nocardia farcinica]SUE28929.1 Uncharacterised protein [Nocardia farcinica]
MDTPTPLQEHLIKAVQNIAYDNQQLLERHRATGDSGITPQLARHLQIGDRSREQLEHVALSVGVPKAWLDYARAAGQRGARWQPGRVMLGAGHVPRGALIAALGRDVHALQDLAGIAAAHTSSSRVDADTFARFRRVMGMTWQRLGAISHALALSEEERHQVWQRGNTHWTTAVAAHVGDYSVAEVSARWHQVARSDFTAVSLPVLVLQAAGVTHDDITAQMPISPDRMVELTAAALTHAVPPPVTVTDPQHQLDPTAAQIHAALEATGLDAADLPEAFVDPGGPADVASSAYSDHSPGP